MCSRSLSRLSQLSGWMFISLLALGITLLPVLTVAALRARCFRRFTVLTALEQRLRAADRRSFLARLLLLLGGTVLIAALINFTLILTLEPGTPDVQQFHLARVAYYLQHGNMNYFPATYWAQVVSPKVATVLLLYTYLVSGSLETLTQLVQFFAYFVCMLALYGVCRFSGQCRKASLFAGLIFGLLIICLMEASTAQNDLLQAAYFGVVLYAVLAYRRRHAVRYLALAAVAFALAAGVKATLLPVLPSLLLVTGVVLFTRRWAAPPITRRHLAIALGALFIAGAVITMPAGYSENIRLFHNPLGPKSVRAEYTEANHSAGAFLRNGVLNILRYGVDFLVLDGSHPLPGAHALQNGLTALPRALFTRLGINLESANGTRKDYPFTYHKLIAANENTSCWGVFGFLLIWPVILLALCGVYRAPSVRLFALAAVLNGLMLSFFLPYDHFHGRFDIITALFALPPLGACAASCRGRLSRAYLTVVVLLGCVCALTASTFRYGSPLIPYHYAGAYFPSVFKSLRTDLLVRETPGTPLATCFEFYVPEDAVVAVDTVHPGPEYIYFGSHFTRRVIPLHPFWGAPLPIPRNAQYLVFDEASKPRLVRQHGDIPLTTADFPLGVIYLRKLARTLTPNPSP